MGYALRDDRRYTYADYLSWPEDARYELIDGAAFLMAPAPSFNHQVFTFEVAHQARAALEGKPCRVIVSPIDVPRVRHELARIWPNSTKKVFKSMN